MTTQLESPPFLLSDKTQLSRNLRLARVGAKLTQTEVAAAVGKSRQTINAWEREEDGAPTPDETELAKLADLYGRSVRDLRYADLGGVISEPRPVSYSSLPKHLVALAAKFEIEALEMG